jgi:uncharacterized membrane protein
MVNELTVLKSIHILAAALWVGGGFAVNVAMFLAPRSGDPANMLAALRLAKVLGQYVFLPLSVIVLAAGVWLTEKYYAWDELWISFGLLGLFVASAVGALYLAPKAAAGIAAIERGDPPPQGRNWVPIVARLNLLLISAVLVLMVIRPT